PRDLAQLLEALHTVLRVHHRVRDLQLLHRPDERLGVDAVVFHQQYVYGFPHHAARSFACFACSRRCAPAASTIFHSNLNTVPVPCPASTGSCQMRPPCHSTTRLTIARPIPLPSTSSRGCSVWNI